MFEQKGDGVCDLLVVKVLDQSSEVKLVLLFKVKVVWFLHLNDFGSAEIEKVEDVADAHQVFMAVIVDYDLILVEAQQVDVSVFDKTNVVWCRQEAEMNLNAGLCEEFRLLRAFFFWLSFLFLRLTLFIVNEIQKHLIHFLIFLKFFILR